MDKKNKLDQLKTTAVTEFTELLANAEKLIDATKDAAAIFTCEMADHIKPEDTVAAKEKTDAHANPAQEALKKAREFSTTKEAHLRQFPPAEVAATREALKPLMLRLANAEKDFTAVRGQAMACFRKAQQFIDKKKREEQQVEAKKERERVAKWNKELIGHAYVIGLVAEDIMKGCEGDCVVHKYREAESQILGLHEELEKRKNLKECLPQTKHSLGQYVRKIDACLKKIKALVKEKTDKEQDLVRVMAVKVAKAAQEKKNKFTDETYFSNLTSKAPVMKQFHFTKFINSLRLNCDCTDLLWKEACKMIGPDTNELSVDEFLLHIMHAYHMVLKPATVQKAEEPDSEVLGQLEANQVIEVVDGPKEVGGAMRIKVVYHPLEGDSIEGWTTMRLQGEDFLVRYSPHYVVLAETVLTDVFDLNSFKVVRRIKVDEKVRALKAPVLNTESSMWRIYAVTGENEKVWVTVESNKGTPLLKNTPAEEVIGENQTVSETFDETKFNKMARKLSIALLSDCSKKVDAVKEAKEKIESAISDLDALDADGAEPSQEEVKAAVDACDQVFQAHKAAQSSAFLTVKQLHMNIQNIESGPFGDIKEELGAFNKFFAEANTETNGLREKQRSLAKSVTSKEAARRLAREKAEQEAQCKKFLREIGPFEKRIEASVAKVEEIENRALPTMADSLNDYGKKMSVLRTDVKNLQTEAQEIKAWIEENGPKSGKGPLQEAYNESMKQRQKCIILLQKCNKFLAKAHSLELNLKEKIRVDFALALNAYVMSKGKKAEEIFEDEFKGAESVELEVFCIFAEKICAVVPCFEDMIKSTLGGSTVTKEHFGILANVSYRCVKRALITDIVEIKTCKRLKKIEPEEVIEVVQHHVVDPSTNLIRFRGRSSDGLEGYLTINGNKGSQYFKLQQNGYRVIKDTVFTDKCEMEEFKLLRRLKEGDLLRGLSNPIWEEKSNLWRMKAQALDGKENNIGWVTLKGNQGSAFLVNCELPEEPIITEEKPDGEKPDVDMTAEA